MKEILNFLCNFDSIERIIDYGINLALRTWHEASCWEYYLTDRHDSNYISKSTATSEFCFYLLYIYSAQGLQRKKKNHCNHDNWGQKANFAFQLLRKNASCKNKLLQLLQVFYFNNMKSTWKWKIISLYNLFPYI